MPSKSVLSAIAFIMAAGSIAKASSQSDAGSLQAAQAIDQLIGAGYAKFDSASGKIELNTSVINILKENGIAKESRHSEELSAGCSSTTGQNTGSEL